MVSETIEIQVILRHYFKKGLSAAKASREICSVKGEDAMPERTAQWWYKRFKADDMDLEDKPRTGRPSIVDQGALRDAIEANPGSSTYDLSDELGQSQPTIWRHLHALGFESKRPRVIPHELKPEQAQKRVDICHQLLQNPQNIGFWRRIVTSDEKWIFLRNPDTGNQWLRPGQTGTPVVRRGRFEKKVMLCVWWNFEGIGNWFQPAEQ